MAKDFGFDGIEIRGLGSEIFAVRAQPFTESQLPDTIKKLSELRLEIPCLSSGCCLKFAENAENNYQEIIQYIMLASKLGTPYIRILADLEPQPDGEVDDGVVLSTLQRLVPMAEEKGITLLWKPMASISDTTRLCGLLNQCKRRCRSLVGMHHTYRFGGENGKTVQNLGAYIKYVHIKDSVVENGRVSYL
jgi:fatty-acyl-CoA synthase